MRNKIGVIVLLLAAVLFGTAALIVAAQQIREEILPFSVQIYSGDKTESVNGWKDDAGAYYIFLPSYADLAETRIFLNTSAAVWLDSSCLNDGTSCEKYQLNVPYKLSYETLYNAHESTLTFMKSANTATMYIETSSQSMDYIHAEKGNEETGKICLYDSGGVLNYEDLQISIKGRGNATWTDSEKKSYSLDLSGEADLLDMGTAQRWILLANGLDQSNLRNKIVYEFAKEIGFLFSPESKWVDLFLNGEYAGLYLLCERNEVHPERLNISSENSFLISSELENRLVQQNYPYILTDTGLAMRIHYPRAVTEKTQMTLSAKWKAIESAILAENGMDPETGKGWEELIDLDSWARKYLIDEVFGNLDAYIISQYYYINGNEENGKVYAGPVWDYDAAIGNPVTWQLGNPHSIFAGRLKFSPGVETTLIYELSQKDDFQAYAKELYISEFLPQLEVLITEKIYTYVTEIEKSADMNQIRWSIDEDVFSSRDYIIDFLTERNRFLQSMWVEGVVYHQVLIDQGIGTMYAHFAVPSGTCLTKLPQFESTPYQDPLGLWYYSDTNQLFDITKPITEDIEIYAAWTDSTDKKIGQITKILPLAVIAVIGVGLVYVAVKRMRKSR